MLLSHAAPYINVCVGLVSSEAGWSCVFLVKHRFCGGPFDGKSSDPGDRIGFGAVKDFEGCYGAEGSMRGCRMRLDEGDT
jgi:hypothetical protein